jgi:hypothetical protein
MQVLMQRSDVHQISTITIRYDMIRKYSQHVPPSRASLAPRLLYVSHMIGCWIYSPQNEIMHADRVINGVAFKRKF